MNEQAASLQAGDLEVRFDPKGGTFDIRMGRFSLTGMTAGFETARGTVCGADLSWEVADRSPEKLTAAGRADGLTLKLTFQIERVSLAKNELQALTIVPAVSSDRQFSLERIILLKGADIAVPRWMFLNAGRGWTNGTHDTIEGRSFTSATIAGWTDEGETLFFTFPFRQPLHCNIRGKTDGGKLREYVIDCEVLLDDIAGEVRSSPLTLCITDNPLGYLEAYGDRQRTPDFRPIQRRPVFWNTWDYIVNLVSEEYVLKNLDFIANDPVLSKAVEYIVIDDGWEHLYGEWEPNYRFPHGMEWLARRIIDRGFKAGIWFAPNVVENCSIPGYWDEHLLAGSMGGRPCQSFECMIRYGFALDIMKPEARDWLREVFARYRRMGYTLFKLDYLRHITKAAKFGGKRVPKGDLIGEVVKVVREGAGEDAHILGSVHRAGSGAGMVDSNRISGDIAPRWEIVCRNVRNIAALWWAHEKLWCNDPDFAVCRGPETSDDPNIDRIHVNNVFIPPDDDVVLKEEDALVESRFVSLMEARTLQSPAR